MSLANKNHPTVSAIYERHVRSLATGRGFRPSRSLASGRNVFRPGRSLHAVLKRAECNVELYEFLEQEIRRLYQVHIKEIPYFFYYVPGAFQTPFGREAHSRERFF